MEMPTPCLGCGNTFEITEGISSGKYYPNHVICEKCGNDEHEEIELCDNFYDALNWVWDKHSDIDGIFEAIYQVYHFRRFGWTKESDLKGIMENLKTVKETMADIRDKMDAIYHNNLQ